MRALSRRRFCAIAGSSVAGLACRLGVTDAELDASAIPRLTARPFKPTRTLTAGYYRLWDGSPSSFLLVPKSYVPGTPAPLVVSLHGAGATAEGPYNLLRQYAEDNGFLQLIPESLAYTWDGIGGVYSHDLK